MGSPVRGPVCSIFDFCSGEDDCFVLLWMRSTVFLKYLILNLYDGKTFNFNPLYDNSDYQNSTCYIKM